MTLLQWVLVSTLASLPATPAQHRAIQASVQREATPRVIIGEAVLTIYDESGKPVAVD